MSQRTAQPSSWVWLLAIFTLASLVDAAFYGQILAFTPLHLAALGLTPARVTTNTGRLASLTWAVGVPFLPLWGALADRYSRQPVIARSFLAFFVAGLLMLIARDVWIFALGRVVMSFALGNSGLMMATLAERVPPKRLGMAFAIMNSAAPIGYFTGPIAGGPAVDAWGFSTLLLINMALVLFVALAIAFGYRDRYQSKSDAPLWRMTLDSIGIVGRSAGILGLFAAMFAVFLGWEAVLPYVPVIATNIYHGPNPGTAVGFVVGASGLSTIVIGPAVGMLADRYGRWRVLFAVASLSVVLLPLPLLAHTLSTITLTWAAANGTISAMLALSFTVLSDATREESRGRVMSLSWLPLNLSATIGPLIGSAVAGYNIWWLFPAAAIMTALGIGVLALVARQVRPAVARAATG